MKKNYYKVLALILSVFAMYNTYGIVYISSGTTNQNNKCNVIIEDGASAGVKIVNINAPAGITNAMLNIRHMGIMAGDTITIQQNDASGDTIYHKASNDISFFLDTAVSVGAADAYIRIVHADAVQSNEYSIEWIGLLNAAVTPTDITCKGLNNGIINIAPANGAANYTYSINGSQVAVTSTAYNATSLLSGVYVCSIIDNNGCKYEETVTVQEDNPTFNASITERKISCSGGQNNGIAKVNNISGVTSYLWNNISASTSDTATSLHPQTTYMCQVTGTGGCKVYTITTSPENSAIVTGNTLLKNACSGKADGAATVTATGGIGGFTFLWPNASTLSTRTNLLAGAYNVTVTDANGCSEVETVSISNTPALNVTEATTSANSYATNTGSVTLTALNGTPPYKYIWGSDTTTVTPLIKNLLYAGIFNYKVIDNNDCSVSDTVKVTEPTDLLGGTIEIVNSVTDSAYCQGVAIDFQLVNVSAASGGVPNSGVTYIWETKTASTGWTVDAASANSVSITFTGRVITKDTWFRRRVQANSDVAYSNEVKYTFVAKPAVTIQNLGAEYCQNNDIIVNLVGVPTFNTGVFTSTHNFVTDNGNGTASFTPALYNDTILSGASTKSVSYSYIDNYGCIWSTASPYTTVINPKPIVSELVNNVLSNGQNTGSVTLTASNGTGAYILNWTGTGSIAGTNPFSIGTLTAGIYSYEIKDSKNCKYTDTVKVTEPTDLLGGTIEIVNSVTDSAYCQGVAIDFQLVNVSAASGGVPNSGVTYIWETKTASTGWTVDAASANSASITFTGRVITKDTWFRRRVQANNDVAYSNEVKYTFVAKPVLKVFNLGAAYCQNNESVIDIVGVPSGAGSSFTSTHSFLTDNGDGTATFSPSLYTDSTIVTPQTKQVVYNYTDSYGCQWNTGATYSTVINPKPAQPYFDLPEKLSKSDTSHQIEGIVPGGGVFTGEAITAGGFINMMVLNEANYTYKYTVGNGYGCTNSYSANTSIVAGAGSFFDTDGGDPLKTYFCKGADSASIFAQPTETVTEYIGYVTASGTPESRITWKAYADSASGSFDPNDFTEDVYIVRFQYKSNASVLTIEKEIRFVDMRNTAQINDLSSKYCASLSILQITAPNVKTNETGIFSGTGIFNPIGNRADFNIGTFNTTDSVSTTVKYLLTDNTSGCKDSVLQNVKIYALPEVGFYVKDTFFVQGEEVSFTSVNPAAGGVFTGEGVGYLQTSFNPKEAGLGEHNIKFTFDEPHGTLVCKNDTVRKVLVEKYRGTIGGIPSDSILCGDEEPIKVYYTKEAGYAYSNGYFVFNSDTVYGDTLQIDPTVLKSANNYIIKYVYTGSDAQTKFWIDKKIYIDDIGDLKIMGLESSYCRYSLSDTIWCNAKSTEISRNGLFTFDDGRNDQDGLYLLIDANKGKAKINPADVIAETNKIYFTYNSPKIFNTNVSTCSKRDSAMLIVYDAPVASFNIRDNYNVEESADTLLGLPSGGKFDLYGKNIYTADSVFNPKTANSGSGEKTINVSYAYTNPITGCSDTVIHTTVVENATGYFEPFGTNGSYCYYDANYQLVIADTSNSNGAGGLYSGAGISAAGIFNPVTAYNILNTGTDTLVTVPLVFEYKGRDNITTFYIHDTAYVINNGDVEILNLADTSFCANGDTVHLSATRSGGVFSGNAIANTIGIFNPKLIVTNVTTTTRVTYTYDDPSGACSQIVKIVDIEIRKIPEINIQANTSICANSTLQTFSALPSGGTFTSDLLLNTISANSVTYLPTTTNVGINNIYYSYYDPVLECSNTDSLPITVNAIPNLEIIGFTDTSYCKESGTVSLQGMYNSTIALKGDFNNIPVINNGTANDGKAVFNPTIEGRHTVQFTYTDNNGCTNTTDTSVTVHPLPDISISGLTSYVYCENSTEVVPLVGNFTGVSKREVFYVNQLPESRNSFSFEPDKFQPDYNVHFRYEVTDFNGCENTASDSAYIYRIPSMILSVSDKCIADSVQFTLGYDNTKYDIVSYKWSFFALNDPNDAKFAPGADSVARPKVKYSVDGRRTVSLTVEEAKYGCINQKVQDFYFEQTPNASFSWINECLSSGNVEFTPSAPHDPTIYNYIWNFGDNSIQNGHSIQHSYADTGTYNVSFRIQSINSECAHQVNKELTIRPSVKFDVTDKYTQSFEEMHGGWVPESLNNNVQYSWQLGEPSGALIKNALDGNKAYVTNLSGSYNAYEQSAITSPCFDLTGLTRPMISLGLWQDLEKNRDGVVLQYRTNERLGEAGWKNIGDFVTNAGVNWHNSLSVNGLRDISDREGWDGESQKGWIEAKHDLDFLKNQSSVRFRLAFGADDIVQNEGVALDKIRIGNRERKVIVENFTNAMNNIYQITENGISSVTATIPNDVIELQYHAGYPAGDPLYKSYPGAANTRISYYSIAQIPYAVYDGTVKYAYTKADNLSSSTIIKRALKEPVIDIQLEVTKGTSIDIRANIKTDKPDSINNRNLHLLVYIVENNVIVNADNKTLTFNNVVRKMLPDASGTYLKTNWNTNETETLSFNYLLTAENKPNDIVVVAFVQDEDTKEILQAVTSDDRIFEISAKEVFGLTTENGANYIMYPNPASSYVDIAFSRAVANSDKLVLMNQQGALVMEVKPLEGEYFQRLNVSALQDGLYYIMWIHNNEQIVKKLIKAE